MTNTKLNLYIKDDGKVYLIQKLIETWTKEGILLNLRKRLIIKDRKQIEIACYEKAS